MKREDFLEKCRAMECVENIKFDRGCYNITLKKNWYSYWRGDFVTFTYYNFTTMEIINNWLSKIYFIAEDNKEATMNLITEIENAKDRVESIESNINMYDRKLKDNKKYLVDERLRLDKLNKEFDKINKEEK
ncbi:MAG: hypothetical protein ACRDBY_05060 [Cetobacterium sp.]